ncbi:hypothetical protein TFLX_04016 [Thermoflexales bacterium]|nr:hypothetical protein TFLX_04016 [Thermoflexales bacterium]
MRKLLSLQRVSQMHGKAVHVVLLEHPGCKTILAVIRLIGDDDDIAPFGHLRLRFTYHVHRFLLLDRLSRSHYT